MLCAAIANAYACKVDEGSVHPCIINGHDYGELLYSLGVMGWFMLVTIPGGLVAFVSWLIFLILHCVAWRKRVSAGTPLRFPRRLQQHENLRAPDFCLACSGVRPNGSRVRSGRSAVTRHYSRQARVHVRGRRLFPPVVAK